MAAPRAADPPLNARTEDRSGDRPRGEGVPPIADALIRAVLDTNVLISGLRFGGTPAALIEAALRGEFTLVTSDALLAELEGVLVSRFAVPPELARRERSELAAAADVATPAAVSGVLRDPNDDIVLATAVGGSADRIVSGDRDLLSLERYGLITLVAPRAFLAELASRQT